MSKIKATTDYAYTSDGSAFTQFRLSGTTVEAVADMIQRDELSNFAGGRSIKVGDKPGRYAFNPLGGPPGTLRDLDANPDGSFTLTLRGPIHGGGQVEIKKDTNGDVLIREKGIRYKPDLRFVPVAGQVQALAEALPFGIGSVAKAIRTGFENVAGAPLAALHVEKAKNGELTETLVHGLSLHEEPTPKAR
ncbi:MAG: hypothetical protein U1E65_30630 [Myxococcota bacterium]